MKLDSRIFILGLCFFSLSVTAADNFTLHEAIQSEDKAKVESLLSQGADVNSKTTYGVTPLHQAAAAGDKYLAELLLNKGADVNAKNNWGGNSATLGGV